MELEQTTFDIVPAHLAVGAMRDNGYKNAGSALAELIDNSIQAGSEKVEVLCSEREVLVTQRVRRQIHQIGVLDNGSGMDATTLRMALQFGNGTHLDDRTGIGRFGMGLPSASISQCRRVEVWTWQGGMKTALYSFIDIDDIADGSMREVPEPHASPLPKVWRAAGNVFGPSGTLVVWSKIDRSVWKTATAIFRHSEFIIGRMYRRFLKDENVSIRMAAFLEDSPSDLNEDRCAVLNDPTYLMAPSSCPAPYDQKPMFRVYGDTGERKIRIHFDGAEHDVLLRFAYAEEEARKDDFAGATPYGQHAAKNVGVSVMRAGRELELSQAWVNPSDPRERWWGVEIEFPPALDELFGVSNNKQTARNLEEVARLDLEPLVADGATIAQVRDQMIADGDPVGPLLDIRLAIESNLNSIRRLLRAQTAGQRRQRHDDSTVEQHATEVTERRKQEGHEGQSDDDESLPAEEREEALREELVEAGLATDRAGDLAAHTVHDGLKYVFAIADIETSAFFSVKPKAGVIVVTLNMNHPAYKHLIEVTEEVPDDADSDELRQRLQNAADGLKLLLTAWARYEDEQPSSGQREKAQDVRADWGRMARQFLSRDD